MQTKKTDIIPIRSTYIGVEDEIDYRAICFYVATNLFLGDDTHFKGKKCLQPGKEYQIENEIIKSEKSWFEWSYQPRDVTLEQSVDEFEYLFEKVTKEQLNDNNVILPLSGGLDSRTQASALLGRKNVKSYSYEYPNGIKETEMAGAIAHAAGYSFQSMKIPNGYLWDSLDEVGALMGYEGDITVTRQAAFIEDLPKLGEIFYLGHWGDVLFDDMGVNDQMSEIELIDMLLKKIVKRGGVRLANSLWQTFGLKGDMMDELKLRVGQLLSGIKITNNNAKVRAFKSLYWAPRWTSIAMPIFSKYRPISLPFYDEQICKFITTIPEKFLAGRQIQIEYIKRKSKTIASVPWQAYAPLNLYNYKKFHSFSHLPYRVSNKIRRELKKRVSSKEIIQRNWEMQLLGESNDKELRKWLFENEKLNMLIPTELVNKYYEGFTGTERLGNAYPLCVLLTLSVFAKNKL